MGVLMVLGWLLIRDRKAEKTAHVGENGEEAPQLMMLTELRTKIGIRSCAKDRDQARRGHNVSDAAGRSVCDRVGKWIQRGRAAAGTGMN